MLTAKAIELNYIKRNNPIKGATLDGWIIDNKAPLWTCKAALILCLDLGWIPVKHSEWTVFSHLLT
ncbi:hypothetical protein [Spartinivicinus poritis]|uniref:Uncharacterized protein n=1 Tax=Spartinivicinus poritis TaxID=2994640 RepID=A0ABT5UJ76_9GAMM|nr:hypothetical protein [Spartinivicinus sp. A2-2]MDE1466006.1 hypothetical protein [Spartinivicinus sp. A2-2]